jgi:hypothetical protein
MRFRFGIGLGVFVLLLLLLWWRARLRGWGRCRGRCRGRGCGCGVGGGSGSGRRPRTVGAGAGAGPGLVGAEGDGGGPRRFCGESCVTTTTTKIITMAMITTAAATVSRVLMETPSQSAPPSITGIAAGAALTPVSTTSRVCELSKNSPFGSLYLIGLPPTNSYAFGSPIRGSQLAQRQM